MKQHEYVTVAEGAKRVGRSPVTVRYWAQRGHVIARKSGGTWLIWFQDLRHFAGLYQVKRRAKTQPAADHAGGINDE